MSQSSLLNGKGSTFLARQFYNAAHVSAITFDTVVVPTRYWYDMEFIASPIAKYLKKDSVILFYGKNTFDLTYQAYLNVIDNRAAAGMGSRVTVSFVI